VLHLNLVLVLTYRIRGNPFVLHLHPLERSRELINIIALLKLNLKRLNRRLILEARAEIGYILDQA
jgi:hypothetical protein